MRWRFWRSAWWRELADRAKSTLYQLREKLALNRVDTCVKWRRKRGLTVSRLLLLRDSSHRHYKAAAGTVFSRSRVKGVWKSTGTQNEMNTALPNLSRAQWLSWVGGQTWAGQLQKKEKIFDWNLDSAECQKTSVDANEVKEWVECQSNSMQVNKVATSSKVQLKLILKLQDGEQTAVSLWRPHVTPPSWLLNHTFTTFPVKLSAETVSLWMMDFAKFREESWPADTHTVLALAWWQPKPFYSWCHFMLS